MSSVRNSWLVFALAVTSLFLVANRGAYRGFFTDDDFDHIFNAKDVELSYYGTEMLKPKLAGNETFRPVSHLYYFVLARTAGLRYSPYITTIHLLHLLNVVLVWALVRALGASPFGAAGAALLFAFHMAAFKLYWEPMYIFDLVCGTFILASLHSYIRGRWILSLVFFWLALKSKEVAILFPLMLAGYEWWFGKKRWKPLAPFFAISAILGIQALASNTHRDNDYSLRFTSAAIWTCAQFYAAQLVQLPGYFGFAGFAVVGLPFFIRNRLVRFGVLAFVSMLLLMLVLPGRLFGAYLYIPLIGIAIALSAATRPVWLALFFVVWIPWNFYQLRIERRSELAQADERRSWFQPVANFIRTHPDIDTFVYDGEPDSLAPWGVKGAVRDLRPSLEANVTSVEAPEAQSELAKPRFAVIVWDPGYKRVHVLPHDADVPYIRLGPIAPLWQLGEGWLGRDPNFRWMGPHATARLQRPADARMFEVLVYVPTVYIETLHQGQLEVRLDHRLIGTGVMDKAEPTTFRFNLPPSPPGPVDVEFSVSPPLKDPSGAPIEYGAPIASFGFSGASR